MDTVALAKVGVCSNSQGPRSSSDSLSGGLERFRQTRRRTLPRPPLIRALSLLAGERCLGLRLQKGERSRHWVGSRVASSSGEQVAVPRR